MVKQNGSAMVALAAVAVIMVLLVAIAGVSYVSAYNYGNAAEKKIAAQYDSNKNTLSQYSVKVAEAAQVPGMMRDDLTKVVTAALEGRYGENGSQATFQWIQEQNPTIDPQLYVKIQQIVEAGRSEFKISQDQLIDQKRAYETQLGYLWRGFWLRVAGYPKVDLASFKIIVDSGTTQKFESGVDEVIQLR